jgi:hypothetical protein
MGIPFDAIPAGTDANGMPLYSCLVQYAGGLQPGKTRSDWGGCSISYGGQEVFVNDSYQGWATSNDGLYFTPCNGDNAGRCQVPKLFNQADWRGDPAIAAAPQGGGIVVYENMALDTSQNWNDKPHLVVAALSFDGGAHFVNSVLVNDGSCTNNVDQGAVAFDPTSSTPDIWFVFRHNGVGVGAGTYGLCVRGGTVNPSTHSIDWFGPAHEVGNVQRAFGYGVGGALVQPGYGNVTVVYSNTDHEYTDCSWGKDITWYSVTSWDGGWNWTSSKQIYDTPSFAWCTTGNHYLNSIRAFGFARDGQGNLWTALNDSLGSIRVFTSSNEGWSWTQSNYITVPGYPSLYLPTVAADAAGRVTVGFYGSDAGGTTMSMFTTTRDLIGWYPPVPIGARFTPGGYAARRVGDYNGMTVVPADAFHLGDGEYFVPTWADDSGFINVGLAGARR